MSKSQGQSHLILGGRRSGKSTYAENLALRSHLPKTYVATSRIYDDDHRARIARHRQRREGQGWQLLEVPKALDLQERLYNLAEQSQVVLIDCLSMWLNNVFLDGLNVPELKIPKERAQFILVSMEVGLGLHPQSPLGRQYADALGHLNQAVAQQVDRVTFIAAGLPLSLKG